MYDWLIIGTIVTALWLIILIRQKQIAREEAKPVPYLGTPAEWREKYPDPDVEPSADELCPGCRNKTLQKWVGPFLEHRSRENLWLHHKQVSQWRCDSCGYRGHASLGK